MVSRIGKRNLRDYIQDLRNANQLVSDEMRPQFMRSVLQKVTGAAKKSLNGKTVNNIDELIQHLKQRFGPGRNFSYYNTRIQNVRMRENDTVGDFYDEINILLSSAENALKEEKGQEYKDEMMIPIKNLAVDIFIKGLPASLAERVDFTKPANLTEAYNEAVRLETRMEAKIIPDSRPYRGRRENYGNQGYHDNLRNQNGYGNNGGYQEQERYHNGYRNRPYVGYVSEQGYDESYVGQINDQGQGESRYNQRGNNYRANGYNQGGHNQSNYQRNNYNGGNYSQGYNNGPRQGNNWRANSWNGGGNGGNQHRLFDHQTGGYRNYNNRRGDRREGYNNNESNWRSNNGRGFHHQNNSQNLNYQGARQEPRLASQDQRYQYNQNQNNGYQNQNQGQQNQLSGDQQAYRQQIQDYQKNKQSTENPMNQSANDNTQRAP